MLDPKAFEVDTKARETYWAMDPDVDLGASDINRWHETGEGLEARQEGHPSLIRWRPLNALEQSGVARRSGGDQLAVLALCAAYGLLSVEGLVLRTESTPYGRAVLPVSLAALEQLSADVPGIGKVSVVAWLGGLIAGASFRERG